MIAPNADGINFYEISEKSQFHVMRFRFGCCAVLPQRRVGPGFQSVADGTLSPGCRLRDVLSGASFPDHRVRDIVFGIVFGIVFWALFSKASSLRPFGERGIDQSACVAQPDGWH
ncbi:hypothetical protein [uncultured Thalassospira sp.]|uniref:hypothetical protein n=1 Tax=uncultured Thalassospira sp. TaxID=404382 RepID=UPI00259A3576|nr:hypothetical protein [uncultured Thalassospira sp.]